MFYSRYRKKFAGNFFTERRIAAYWIDQRNSKKNKVTFAYYQDIEKIDTFYIAAPTYTSYMSVMKNDSSIFNVYVNGKKEDVKMFFEEALREWQKSKR